MLDELHKLCREAVWEFFKSHVRIALALVGGVLVTACGIAGRWLWGVLDDTSVSGRGALLIVGGAVCAIVAGEGVILWCWRRSHALGEYYRDEIEGVIWEWNPVYLGVGAFEQTLEALCPKCLHEMTPKELGSPFGGDDMVRFVCPLCQKEWRFDGTWGRICGTVKKRIEQRQRTGKYRLAGKRIRALHREVKE